MANSQKPTANSYKVAVLMGSDSDWQVMQRCVEQLEALDIDCDVQVMSAHRTPEDVRGYVAQAAQDNIGVFIAAAGMSAALAGVVAAESTLPVIGVPIDSGSLQGLDALLSTVQMPPGVPVAAMAIGPAGAKNAALLAARILALSDPGVQQKLEQFRHDQAEKVREKNQALQGKLQKRS